MKKKRTVPPEKRSFVPALSDEEKRMVHIMFFGPYIDEWRLKNGIVDNSDATIAKRLNLSVTAVSGHTERICKDHFKMIEKLYKVKK